CRRTPCSRRRYWSRVPACMRIGGGVTIAKCNQGGVIASRLWASLKKANTSSSGRGSHTAFSRRCVFRVLLLTHRGKPVARSGDRATTGGALGRPPLLRAVVVSTPSVALDKTPAQ